MAAEYICDGCGKRAKAQFYKNGDYSHPWHKPHSWFQRVDEDGPQDACSRECIDKIAAKTNKTSVVRPI